MSIFTAECFSGTVFYLCCMSEAPVTTVSKELVKYCVCQFYIMSPDTFQRLTPSGICFLVDIQAAFLGVGLEVGQTQGHAVRVEEQKSGALYVD